MASRHLANRKQTMVGSPIMNDSRFDPSSIDRRHFEFKGKRAEQAIHELANRSFLRDWCYPNPRWANGREICDLLVSFEQTLLILQIKDIAFTGNETRYLRKAIDDPIRQVIGAEKNLRKKGTTPSLLAASGASTTLNMSDYRNVHLLVVTLGDADVDLPALQVIENRFVHVFDRDFGKILNELDTISDFGKFIMSVEELHRPERARQIIGRQVDLMADYIFNAKSFDHLIPLDMIVYEHGIYEDVISRPEYLAKRHEDRFSYVWDYLVEETRSSNSPDYREIAQELSRPNRFERRVLSEMFLGAESKAATTETFQTRYCPPLELKTGTTHVFLFTETEMDREERRAMLGARCFVARDQYRSIPRVLGIATERGYPKERSFDFVLLNAPTWSDAAQRKAASLREEFHLLRRVEALRNRFDEYPVEGAKEVDPRTDLSLSSKTTIRSLHKTGRNELCLCGSGKKYKKCHGA